ncbi:hypothetical protein DPMN_150751 [Dreissena polymorpha]|uniref:Uncharacterized protein n=1 Tax=Dreissena polymorpha TaxID=45954 RepID=A0A9D4FIK1_DREPO|nr:hypothetical protein DPMN_150751 [Dreissena polymorpha]
MAQCQVESCCANKSAFSMNRHSKFRVQTSCVNGSSVEWSGVASIECRDITTLTAELNGMASQGNSVKVLAKRHQGKVG